MSDLQDQAIRQHCKALRLPTIGSQFRRLAETAIREQQSHPGYLEALLAAEMEERESRAIARLLHDARLPRMKRSRRSSSTAPASRPHNCADWPRATTSPRRSRCC